MSERAWAVEDEGFPWMHGAVIAWELRALLADCCARVAVGGSLRRSKPLLGDVELVILLSEAQVMPFRMRCERLLQSGRFAKRLNKLGHPIAWNERYRAITFRSVPVDLFITQPGRPWGVNYLLRTGSGEANGVLVTTRGLLSKDGLAGVLPRGMRFDQGQVWQVDENGEWRALDTPSEADVFRACGLPYVAPHLRAAAYYQLTSKWLSQTPRSEIGGRYTLFEGDPPPVRDWEGWARSPEGRWYRLDVADKLARDPLLAAEVAALQVAGEADGMKQGSLFG